MAESGRRSGFLPIVSAGLLTGALTGVASAKPWFRLDVPARLMPGVPESGRTADVPLALALSLTVLAAWGALLVSRGLFRRIVCGYALVAALGVVACVATAPFLLPDNLRNDLGLTDRIGVSPTGWFVVAAVAAVLSTASLVGAWIRLPRWPTMSSRYDAPGAAATATEVEVRTDTELWKALDEGHDPTDLTGPSSP